MAGSITGTVESSCNFVFTEIVLQTKVQNVSHKLHDDLPLIRKADLENHNLDGGRYVKLVIILYFLIGCICCMYLTFLFCIQDGLC